MTEYTPGLDEIRESFAHDYWEVTVRGNDTPEERAERGQAFDRALAAHDAEVAANAWDESRNALASDMLRPTNPVTGTKHVTPNPYRADRIEREATSSEEESRA